MGPHEAEIGASTQTMDQHDTEIGIPTGTTGQHDADTATSTGAGALRGTPAGSPTTDFDEADDLLRRLFDLCTPEQQRRGSTPREALARLSPAERAQLLQRLSPAVREEMRLRIGR